MSDSNLPLEKPAATAPATEPAASAVPAVPAPKPKSSRGRGMRLILDIGVFALGNLLTKLIQFLLLPFYTSVLSREDYGTAELVFNFSQLLMPVATLAIASGVFRYAADNVDRKKLLSSGLVVVLIGEILVTIGAIGVNYYHPMQYVGFFSILLLGEALKSILGSVTRGFGYPKRFILGGPVEVLTLFLSNLILIGYYKMGVMGYLWSLVISNYSASLYFLLASKLYLYIRPSGVDKKLLAALLIFSIPMMFNTVIWWFVNMSGRYIIMWRLGEAAAGCYIAASKLPAIINMAATIFQQAWQFSTAKEVQSETRDLFFSQVFRYFAYFIFAVAAVVVAFCPDLADMMLKKEFRSIGYLLPILFTVGLVNCFSSFYGTFYNAFKKNRMITISTLGGAIVSVGLAYWLNIYWGEFGVAIGTLSGFLVIVILRVVDTQLRFVKLQYNVAPIVSLLALYAGEVVVQTMEDRVPYHRAICFVLCFVQLAIVYAAEREQIHALPRKLKNKLAARRRAS